MSARRKPLSGVDMLRHRRRSTPPRVPLWGSEWLSYGVSGPLRAIENRSRRAAAPFSNKSSDFPVVPPAACEVRR